MAGKTIAFVPTMGYLHEGHISLIREAKRHGDEIVVSIFVNPAQFGPGEDFDRYPRSFERDCRMAEETGASVVFNPKREDLYGDGFQTYVTLERLPAHLCGLSRPVFFRGVATVVTKLFNIVKPHVAVFGEKDFQQLQVIRRLVADLDLDVTIIGAPLVREPDGLAMSSRNAYLNDSERRQALSLHQSLETARKMVSEGERRAERLIEAARDRLAAQPDATVDYVAVCDPATLDDVTHLDKPVLMALAVNFGKTRLIDNMMLTP